MVLRTAGPELVQRAVIMMQETHELEDLLDAHQCDGKHALLLYMAKELVAKYVLSRNRVPLSLHAVYMPCILPGYIL